MRLIIVGAGIGGLTATLALLREGFEVTVLEQASTFREVGAGIQISSNGTVVLRQFGLHTKLAAAAIRPESLDFTELESGRLLYRAPLGDAAMERYGGDFFQIHRADLLHIIASAMPPGVVRFDSPFERLTQDEAGVAVTLQSGEVLHADAVIGADGIHSKVRECIHGPESPRFDSKLMWRALIPAGRIKGLELEERCHIWTGPGRSVVAYWLRREELFNFVGTVPSAEVHRESYSVSGDVADLKRSFHGANERVQGLVDAIDQAFITGLFFRDPMERWSVDRVTLLGDAAHAMAPFLAQGACASMEDAWVLGSCLKGHGKRAIPAAFDEYERRRRPRTKRVQAAARAMVKQLHETDERAIRARNGRLIGMSRIDPLAETMWGWLYQYNPLREAEAPLEQVVGLTSAFEFKRMRRPESQRAYDMWKTAFTSEDIAGGIDGMRNGYDRFLRTQFPSVPADTRLQNVDAPVRGILVKPSGGAATSIVLHCHGGGYALGSAHSSLEFAGRLADAIRGNTFVVDYRLAPEHPFPAAVDDAVAAYQWLLRDRHSPRDIFVSGESSGGGLAIAMVLALKQMGLPLPCGVVSICPMTDLTISGPSVREFEGHDPAVHRNTLTFFAGAYFQRADPTNPLVSPLFGDFKDFPPLLVYAAKGEVLESDATRLVARAREAGVDVTMHVIDDSVHSFPLFAFLPEASRAMHEIGAFVASCIRGTLTRNSRIEKGEIQ